MAASAPPSTPSNAFVAPPLTAEEEDALVLARITNDEKALRRVIKKFHTYTTAAPAGSSAEDARDAFLAELASFELSLRKNLLVCEAEARQVEEYQRERQRIADEDVKLRGQIEQLKTSLEHAQMLRKRKIEYDAIAEKINVLPSRDELSTAIQALESDMTAIRAEHDTQERTMQAQRAALHAVVADIGALRLIGKDSDAMETDASRPGSPAPDALSEEREDGEADADDTPFASASQNILNPGAKPFVPGTGVAPPSRTTTPVNAAMYAQRRLGLGSVPSSSAPSSRRASPPPSSQAPSSPKKGTRARPADDDIEMGEVEEDGAPKKARGRDEELEEGEATDASSELSDPPED